MSSRERPAAAPHAAAARLPTDAGSAGPSSRPGAAAPGCGLLQAERVRNWPYPDLRVVEVGGGKISYPSKAHGMGRSFFTCTVGATISHRPASRAAADRGWLPAARGAPARLCRHTLEGEVDGTTVDWRSAAGFARAIGGLRDYLYGAGQWSLAVVGTSGGAPTALAFAEPHPRQTKALLLQAGLTTSWSEAEFAPELLRESYVTAFRRFGWSGHQVCRIIFALLV